MKTLFYKTTQVVTYLWLTIGKVRQTCHEANTAETGKHNLLRETCFNVVQ